MLPVHAKFQISHGIPVVARREVCFTDPGVGNLKIFV
jgi:hypothetical protein